MQRFSNWAQHWAMNLRTRFVVGERGASLVEYALLVGLIAIVCVTAMTYLGQQPGPKLSLLGSGITH